MKASPPRLSENDALRAWLWERLGASGARYLEGIARAEGLSLSQAAVEGASHPDARRLVHRLGTSPAERQADFAGYAEEAERFEGGVFWADAAPQSTAERLLAEALQAMGRGASGSLGMFWRGSLDALESGRRLGFCGSRKASDGALKQTAALARRAALAGWVRVHGGARGADQACALAKPESVQIIVLGGGLAELERRHPLRGLFGGPNLALSPFPLFAPIAQWSLVRRNRAIAALSEALAVAETAPDGGSRHAALMALKLGRAVFVFEGVEEADNARRKKRASEPLDTLSRAEAEAGRRRLVQAGARRLAVGRVCRLPSEELERTLFPAHPAAGKPASQAPPKAIQGELF